MSAWRIFKLAWIVGCRDFQLFWTWRSWSFGWMARILTNAVIWVLVGRLVDDPNRLQYLLVGNASVAGVGTFAIAASAWERWDGTYALSLIAPNSMVPAMMGRMAVWVLHWVGSALCTSLAFVLLLGWRPLFPEALLFPLGVVLLAVSTYCLSLFLGAWVGLVPAIRNITINILTSTILVLCGVTVPLSFWPAWVQRVASILPSTHALRGIRALLGAGLSSEVASEFGLELLVAAGWLALAVLTIDRIAERGRTNGSLELS
jgi:ABC-2 type transport system permease protein